MQKLLRTFWMKLRFQPFDLLKKSLYLNMDLRNDKYLRLTYTFTYSKIYYLNHGVDPCRWYFYTDRQWYCECGLADVLIFMIWRYILGVKRNYSFLICVNVLHFFCCKTKKITVMSKVRSIFLYVYWNYDLIILTSAKC